MCDSYLLLLIVYTKVSPIWNCNVMMMGFEVLSSAHTHRDDRWCENKALQQAVSLQVGMLAL